MNSLLVLLVMCSACVHVPPEKIRPTGMAYHYRAGLFARVAQVRHMPMMWDQVTSFVSVPDCRYVDAKRPYYVKYYLIDQVTGRWGKLEVGQVVDCTNPIHKHSQAIKGIVPGGLEVDWSTARRYHFNWPPNGGHTVASVKGYERLRP